MSATDYSAWSKTDLIARLTRLEATLPASRRTSPLPIASASGSSNTLALAGSSSSLTVPTSARRPPPQPQSHARAGPDLSRLPRRKIALRFCYAGEEYSGLAFQSDKLSTPTVEGTLFAALARARLVDPEMGPEGCGWERSGRTDRGVSGAGNVVSLWVRSALGGAEVDGGTETGEGDANATVVEVDGEEMREGADGDGGGGGLAGFEDFASLDLDAAPSLPSAKTVPTREFRYIHILNQLLPASIRILAWSPVSPTFSARFNTRARHYKYFFSPEGLDLTRMADGTRRLVGEHDFRNLCRVDASKQLTSFVRRVHRADITPYPASSSAHTPPALVGLAALDLIGSAFLYNQVRHIMAVLFLIGAGLEEPSLVSALLNASDSAPGFDRDLPVVDRRPEYQMADALPLVLWDCQYDPEHVRWRTDADGSGDSQDVDVDVDEGEGVSVADELSAALHRSRVRAALDAHFLAAAQTYHSPSPRASILPLERTPALDPGPVERARGVLLPLGGGQFRRARRYLPVLERKRLDGVEEINRRWREGKGARREARRAVEARADADGDGDGGDE